MARRRGRPPSAARAASGSHSDHATASRGAATEDGMSVRGGGGVRSLGRRGGRGRGRRSATPAPPSSRVLGGHSDGMALEFVMELHSIPRVHLHLPRPFARAMEAAKPPILWLKPYGCSHGTMQVHTEYRKRRSMLLERGWKAFARARSLEDGHILCFKLVEDNMLSVKFYGCSGACFGCCEESSSGAECPSSSERDEENSGDTGALGTSGSRLSRSEYESPSSD
ncbi:l-ascorbate oxidase-like protein [Hordeum vulgare]|nr:l-ascorbate oxidase-like protein [Hordeum vulgare]